MQYREAKKNLSTEAFHFLAEPENIPSMGLAISEVLNQNKALLNEVLILLTDESRDKVITFLEETGQVWHPEDDGEEDDA